MMYRVFTVSLPQSVIFGTKLLCWVLSMSFENSTKSPGMSRKTESMLIIIAFMSTMPIS